MNVKYSTCFAFFCMFLMCGVADADGQKRQGTSVAKATENSLRSSSSVSIDDLRDEVRGYTFRSTELEDSLGLYIIDSVADVKELLKQCFKRLKKDLKQKLPRRRYLYTLVNYPARLTANRVCTIENNNGINFNQKEWEPLYADSPVPLSHADSSKICNSMCIVYDFNKFNHLYYHGDGYSYLGSWEMGGSPPLDLRLINLYDIDAYSIRNDSGEGIYRIDFVQKKVKPKKTETNFSWPVHMIRLDFDFNSLRLLNQKGGFVAPRGCGIGYYRHDYGEENGSLVLKYFQSVSIRMPEHKVIQENTVQLMENE